MGFFLAVAVVLLLGTVVVILHATVSFPREIAHVVISSGAGVSYEDLQQLFALPFGAIIALELTHSVPLMVMGSKGDEQVRIVLMIGILAVVRKLIVMEMDQVLGILIFGLEAAVLALVGAFALLLWVDRTMALKEKS
ncbi:phosphate-starvation-inducible PsiE family protein [Ruegeria profundi]|uniref:phosphate-starvation-inducible PsiE family protein n=1 Tax=Ruegeria profundi TaxID=1685378 RepID=UPI003C7D36F0